MQRLLIIARATIRCDLFADGKHQDLNTRFKKTADLDAYIARLLSEGWKLFSADNEQLYFVQEQREAR